ncbi:3-hydroxyacyl-CoA dehydrogenase [Sulfolobus sp. A20]|uniref:3-hydroxyacyl-CoA dehydrogenase family protein n=1 Tax=Saccharolobus sp. A20 TaxID=1891280 RepID=UPI000845ECB1|nr:3-hydroxyacyl-CoA dehydrogenase family protein [Sulfolobus sp. A20]TRM75570.1 3-hydroxyacyl-CoA dehydrogenase family protein [Sulfolobus sp. A20-N-F8]TRM81301.1 3-hydroxyacyl-CoA dehydrogenase family protein [Sulfolobus sp. D5]TRM82394.1 3-hydroxyacyl-CoA dehydrogenase family protein [Sulfolobus sp. A20-N-F6]TRM83500.1 3-hydroxyacyl-CoA dehydrogenase family protein [Sulfolobus sp. F3]TRM88425.1 3-hydroxyacyl-CoA dehydrogenase family protein [Sulfolobus sp. E3]TRM89281.1 3-hydroxyacyl-CoA d
MFKNMENVRTVSVIGAGIIGAGWTVLLVTKGYKVNFYTEKQETLNKGIEKVKNYLTILREVGIIDKGYEDYLNNISMTTDLDKAISNTDFVIEAIIENYDAKKKLFKYLDSKLDKEIVIASSTSGLLMTEIQKAMDRFPERGIIAHPWNPPHLLPLVEIVPGEKTSTDTIEKTKKLMESLDRVIVVLKKEVPGFIGNRLAFALFREAVNLVDEGVATVEDIDKVMTAAIGLRWAFMGPFLTYHLGGGEGGIEYFFSRGFGYGANEWMSTLAKWDKFPYTGVKRVIDQMKEYETIKGKSFQELSKWRDEMLIKVFKLVWGNRGNNKNK